MIGNVWKCDAAWYAERRRLHPELWAFVKRFIAEHCIQSVLEVGGGDARVATIVKRYIGVERNAHCVESWPPHAIPVIGDWCQLTEIEKLNGRFDLVLALAVAEHCPSIEACLEPALLAGPRFIVASFFRGLDRDCDTINLVESVDSEWSEAGGQYYDNAYSRAGLALWLESAGLADRSRVETHGTDAVLVIEL